MTWTRMALLAAVFAMVLSGCGDDPYAPKNFGKGRLGTDDKEPIPAKASVATHLPTEEELGDIRDLETYTGDYRDVLRLMGHPMEITQDAQGNEVWTYPWGSECLVSFDSRRYVKSVDYTPANAD
jgi:hypothetical protein